MKNKLTITIIALACIGAGLNNGKPDLEVRVSALEQLVEQQRIEIDTLKAQMEPTWRIIQNFELEEGSGILYLKWNGNLNVRGFVTGAEFFRITW